MKSTYDVVVAGARCAGASTAMLLARRGLRVLVVDPRRPEADTLSTHALMRAGVLQLHRFGLIGALERANTPLVRTTTFHYPDGDVPVAIKPKGGIRGLYAPRRTVLDAILVDAAREAGAEIVFDARLVDLLRDPGHRVRGAMVKDDDSNLRAIAADWIIGADGVLSPVARLAGARTYRTGAHRTGNVYTYWSGLPLDGYHWYFHDGTSAAAIHTNDDRFCVSAITTDDRFHDEIRFDLEAGFHRVIAECAPELAEALAGGERVEKFRAFAGIPGHLRESWGPGWALVGDAGYFKDPLTAHGISDALRDAEILTRAIVDGIDYQTTRDSLSRDLFDVTDTIASFDWDVPTVQKLHLQLSKAMNGEVEWINGLDEKRAAEVA